MIIASCKLVQSSIYAFQSPFPSLVHKVSTKNAFNNIHILDDKNDWNPMHLFHDNKHKSVAAPDLLQPMQSYSQEQSYKSPRNHTFPS